MGLPIVVKKIGRFRRRVETKILRQDLSDFFPRINSDENPAGFWESLIKGLAASWTLIVIPMAFGILLFLLITLFNG